MAPTTELEMVSGFNGTGQGIHKQWKYTASQLNDLLSTYGTISGTATASNAMELAVKELTTELQNERACWHIFMKFCIDHQADPELADSQLRTVHTLA